MIDWKLLGVIDEREIDNDLNEIVMKLMVVSIILLTLAIVFAYVYSGVQLRGLQVIGNAILVTSKGDFKIHIA